MFVTSPLKCVNLCMGVHECTQAAVKVGAFTHPGWAQALIIQLCFFILARYAFKLRLESMKIGIILFS